MLICTGLCRKLVTTEGCVSIVFIFWLFCILVIAKELFIIYLACVARVVGSLFASHLKIYIDFKTSTINFYFVEKKMTSLKNKANGLKITLFFGVC